MSTEQSPPEPRRSTIVSRSPGLAYERMRDVRQSHFTQPLVRKLAVQGALLVALASTLALTASVGSGPAGGAVPDLATLGAGGGSLVAAAITAHAAVGAYRLRREPITEREALALLTVEDAASYLGIGCGGLLVAATVVATVLGLTTGAATANGTTTAVVATGAVVVAGFAMVAARYLEGRLPNRR